ncbi:MAG: AIR carboxylase family protein [Candidatus Omnitrophica bacterium]|nr:AIR carboxylase family protein [Candidatus Omnitrophota bacterium]MCM8809023.1 AIR carboxylase family protein [Candidatus Omnitrophota bacterium]MCM8810225.1 AIR carboxylase family protein [Candidatus Omnitrophota bacterium]
MVIVDNENDRKTIKEGMEILEELKIPFDIRIISGMENLDLVDELIDFSERKEIDVIIVFNRISTHLPGIFASKTIIPVIGVVLPNKNIQTVDSLFSIIQMPEGIPVACMSYGKAGIKNAALFAAEIISRKEPNLKEKLKQIKNNFI